MLDKFNDDLAFGKKAEDIVLDTFAGLTNKYDFIAVGNNPLYYNCGDILAIDKETGKEVFIEVKNDSRIAETRNVLCEEMITYYQYDYTTRGNMYSSYQIYCVVSEQERKIYVIDFRLLFKNYKKGVFKTIKHAQQESDVYLCELCRVKQWGALIDTIEY